MGNKRKYCGNCKFTKLFYGEWTCSNEDSEAYGLSMDYNDYCEEYEEREDD